MSTYICKCGQAFDKNTEASTTGRRMPDYGPVHECWGCPFVCKLVMRDYEGNGAQDVVSHECRSSKTILYHSEARMSADDTRVGKIYSLDFDFLHSIRDFADTLEGIDPDRYAFSLRPADYATDGRFMLTIYPKPNKAGQAAKGQILDRFFNLDGSRKEMEPEEEKELVLEQIRKAKEAARSMGTKEELNSSKISSSSENDGLEGSENDGGASACNMYENGGRVYHVGPTEDGKYRTYFYFAVAPEEETVCGNLPKCDTAEIAQKMLDQYAQRHEYEVYVPESPKNVIETPENVMESPKNVTEELENVIEFSGNANENAEDQADPPCDWESASGSDVADQYEEDPEPNIPAGERVSLHDPAFGELIDVCDGRINQALRMAVEATQGFTFTAKVTFDPRGGAFGIKYETGYQFDPIKVKSKGELCEEIEIILDDAGYPIIPYDREHQLTIDETMEQDAGATVVTDESGVVQSVDLDDQEGKPESDETEEDTLPEDDFCAENAAESCEECGFCEFPVQENVEEL